MRAMFAGCPVSFRRPPCLVAFLRLRFRLVACPCRPPGGGYQSLLANHEIVLDVPDALGVCCIFERGLFGRIAGDGAP